MGVSYPVAVMATFNHFHCPELKGLIPRESDREKELFELLDYAYIGARYDREYKITKQQLKTLSKYVGKLHEVTEKICKAKIDSWSEV